MKTNEIKTKSSHHSMFNLLLAIVLSYSVIFVFASGVLKVGESVPVNQNPLYLTIDLKDSEEHDVTERFNMLPICCIPANTFNCEFQQELEEEKLMQQVELNVANCALLTGKLIAENAASGDNMLSNAFEVFMVPEEEANLDLSAILNLAEEGNVQPDMEEKQGYQKNETLLALAKEKESALLEYYDFQQKLQMNATAEKAFEVYMVPEEEASLDLSAILILAEEGNVQPNMEEKQGYQKNETLLALAKEKESALLEYYDFQQNLKMYLTEEKENALKTEEWMLTEKCWCPWFTEAFAALPPEN